MRAPEIGVIGGTGVYEIAGLSNTQRVEIDTPYGPPSDVILTGDLEGVRVAFLARHGVGHRLLPAEVPYRANIWALKSLGIRRVIAISACGSLQDQYRPGEIVIPDQLIDRTRGRPGTFFGQGVVAHVAFGEPFCHPLSQLLAESARAAGGTVHEGGAFVIIDGPRFSTRAESHLYRQWGAAIIGMTCLPEAQLAREAELCYAVMAHVTDYDCWHASEEEVSVDLVFRVLQANAELARQTVVQSVRRIGFPQWVEALNECACQRALERALLTPADQIPEEARERLRPIIDKYL